MSSDNERSEIDRLVEEFINISGADEVTARHALRLSQGDLDRALNLYLDEELFEDLVQEKQSTSPVRDPIPAHREQLINNERLAAVPKRVVYPFRNFAHDVSTQESLLVDKSVEVEKSPLEKMFEPPWDLTLKGSFLEARDVATKENKWLLVNVQDLSIFQSSCLDRDVWSDGKMKKFIKQNFIFWQIEKQTVDGEKFAQNYKLTSFPSICVIDPRTGECLLNVGKNKGKDEILFELETFLSTDPCPDCKTEDKGETSEESKKTSPDSKICKKPIERAGSSSSGDSNSSFKRVRFTNSATTCEELETEDSTKEIMDIINASEDDQMREAIRRSMLDCGSTNVVDTNSDHDSSEDDSFDDQDQEWQSDTAKSENDPENNQGNDHHKETL